MTDAPDQTPATLAVEMDDYMSEHMRGHAISNAPHYFTCDRQCRIAAIERFLTCVIPPVMTEEAP
jgi:hypothetical protein